MLKKNYEIIQEEESDCGISCLASIIKYYHGFIPLEDLRIYTQTNNLGTNAYELINCAKKIGFSSYGKKIKFEDLKTTKLPLIAHTKLPNGFYHFVVVYEIKKNHVLIMNPSKGYTKMKNDEFIKIFTGVVLIFNPINELPVYKKNKFINKKIHSFIKNNLLNYVIIIILSLISLILLLLQSIEIKIINYNPDFLYLLIIVIIINELITYLKNNILLNNNIKFNKNIINDFIHHIFKLPLNYLKLKQKGEITTRFKELDDLSNNIINIILDIVFNFIIILFLLFILCKYSIFLTITSSLITFLYNLINFKIYKKLVNKIRYSINLEENYNSNIIDYISNFTTIKHLSIYNYFINNINTNLKNKNDISLYISKKIFLINLFDNIIFNLITLFILYVIIKNKYNVINGIILISIMNYYINIVKKITDYYPSIILYKSIIRKNNDLLSINIKKLDKIDYLDNCKINIKKLNYSIGNKNIIKNLNYVINNNDKVFLCGPSGIGKSSLLKILSNEIINYNGNVLINNNNIKKYDLTNLVSYTSQDENLFNDTILNNLLVGSNINEDELNNVIKICRLNDINIIKECGLESIIINDNSLSGGEKNRIILARSLLHSKKIIILDEVLKEVDYKLEYDIISDIINYYKEKIIIYVSHKDLSSLFNKVLTFRKE